MSDCSHLYRKWKYTNDIPCDLLCSARSYSSCPDLWMSRNVWLRFRLIIERNTSIFLNEKQFLIYDKAIAGNQTQVNRYPNIQPKLTYTKEYKAKFSGKKWLEILKRRIDCVCKCINGPVCKNINHWEMLNFILTIEWIWQNAEFRIMHWITFFRLQGRVWLIDHERATIDCICGWALVAFDRHCYG